MEGKAIKLNYWSQIKYKSLEGNSNKIIKVLTRPLYPGFTKLKSPEIIAHGLISLNNIHILVEKVIVKNVAYFSQL